MIEEATIDHQLADGLEALRMEASPAARAQLLRLVALLLKWNRAYNLTAIRDEARIVSHHLLDSIVLARSCETGRVLDVGSGAGFPGLPLAIVRPSLQVTCLDSSQKKTAFVREAIAGLNLTNCAVVCERVEHWHPTERFDWIVCRAFSELAQFVSGAEHLLADRGRFAALKGTYPGAELERLPAGFRLCDVSRVDVPGVEGERHVVLVERA